MHETVINSHIFKISPNKECAIQALVWIMVCFIAHVDVSGQSLEVVPPPTPPRDSDYKEIIATQEDQRQKRIEEFLTHIKSLCLTATNQSKFILQLNVSKEGGVDSHSVIALDTTDQSLNHSIQNCISDELEDPNLNFGAFDFVGTARRRPISVLYTLPLNITDDNKD